MGNFTFGYGQGGDVGVIAQQRYLLAGGSAGGVNIYTGDVVVLTQKSTLTANGVSVIRTLLAADKTAHYKEGTPVAGILGIALDDYVSDSNGQPKAPNAIGGVASGGQVNYAYSAAGLWGLDPNTKRGWVRIGLMAEGNVWRCALDATSAAATAALSGTLAGLILTGTNTSTTDTVFTIDTNAATADQCIRIIGPDTADPLYGAVGGAVFVQAVGSFNQYLTNVVYSTQ